MYVYLSRGANVATSDADDDGPAGGMYGIWWCDGMHARVRTSNSHVYRSMIFNVNKHYKHAAAAAAAARYKVLRAYKYYIVQK